MLGIDPRDVRTVVLVHCHIDHTGGLQHVAGSRRILVSGAERAIARGFSGKVRGYLPYRWPTPCDLEIIPFEVAPGQRVVLCLPAA